MNKFMRTASALGISCLGLLFLGCNKMESTNHSEESCSLCHSAGLSQFAVHRVHLSHYTLGKFPYRGFPVDSSQDSASQTRLQAYDFECTACHAGYIPDSNAVYNGFKVNPAYHRNGKLDVVFDSAYLGRRFSASDSTRYDYANETCNNIACHGYGRPDTLGVIWNTSAQVDSLTGNTLNCNFCHNVTANHHPGFNCNACHPGTVVNGKFAVDISKHINGVLDTLGGVPDSIPPL